MPTSRTERTSGKSFDLTVDGSVDPKQVVPWEIAHALAQINRFTGQSRFPVSVADHSLRALAVLDAIGAHHRCIRLAVLLHDVPEVYSGDISRPVILLIDHLSSGDFRAWKREFETNVLEAVGVTCLEQQGVRSLIKRADNIALMIEHINHHACSERDWNTILGLTDEDMALAQEVAKEEPSRELSWRRARGKFAMRWVELSPDLYLDRDFYDHWEKHHLI